jgi:hypothetical protein
MWRLSWGEKINVEGCGCRSLGTKQQVLQVWLIELVAWRAVAKVVVEEIQTHPKLGCDFLKSCCEMWAVKKLM